MKFDIFTYSAAMVAAGAMALFGVNGWWSYNKSPQSTSTAVTKSQTVVKPSTTIQNQKKKPSAAPTPIATTSPAKPSTSPSSSTTTITTATPKPATTSTALSGETRFTAYLTGYGWPDNTPPGGAVSHGIIHKSAGGVGTFIDPITLAVGHSIINKQDTLDYPAGTKFYVPSLRRYFIVEDTCGDGSTPQNGPCHTGYQGHPWLDVWVGGQNFSDSITYACQNALTDLHLVIKNPAPNYAVTAGELTGKCTLFGDTILTQ